MTSDRQTEANRRNALLSTGPKTPEGKAIAALNALKHGLLSRDALLPGEDEDALIHGSVDFASSVLRGLWIKDNTLWRMVWK
jgi:hypothetical protein